MAVPEYRDEGARIRFMQVVELAQWLTFQLTA